MNFSIKTDLSKAEKLLKQLSGAEMRKAAAKALNDSAFEARATSQKEMDKSFDKVTPYLRKSIYVTQATEDKLVAVIEPRYMGGKGVDPQNILRASIFGGSRKLKRSEVALNKAGLLPNGYVTVPGDACPLDAYGNIKGSFLVRLISYFQAFGEQGYRANSTTKTRAKLRNQQAVNGFKSTLGVRYFVAYGKLRSGKTGHFHPGIWAATGTHDVKVEPILMFVKPPSYRKILDFFDKPSKAAIDKFNPRFRYHMRTIIEGKL